MDTLKSVIFFGIEVCVFISLKGHVNDT